MNRRVADIEEYLELDGLQTRIRTHATYSEAPDDIDATVWGQAAPDTGADVLDIGCGTGALLRTLSARHAGRLIGCDLSPEAVRGAATIEGVGACWADAISLPFRDAQFDLVLARHMLYHVSDVGSAIREARRVLSPEGSFVVTVNRRRVTPRTVALVRTSIANEGLQPDQDVPNDRVHADNVVDLLLESFGRVDVHRHDNALVFPEPEPLIAYAAALLPFYGVGPASTRRVPLLREIARQARAWFVDHQTWRDPKGYVVCVAR